VKLSAAVVYALHALVYLARHRDDGMVPAGAIATPVLSLAFLQRVLMALVHAGFLRSQRTPGGGYALARPAGEISLLDVVEAVDGPVCGAVPRWTTAAAGVRLDDRLQAVCDTVAEAVREGLAGVSVADLTGEV
jgi:Rrf2 family protein